MPHILKTPHQGTASRCIAIHHLNVGVPQPCAQRLGECLVGFNCGQARKCRSQTVRRKARARTGLEDVRPKLGAGEHPTAPVVPASFPNEPSDRASDAVDSRTLLCKNKCDILRVGLVSVARFRYCDNQCRKNDKPQSSTGWPIVARASSRSFTTTPPATKSHCISRSRSVGLCVQWRDDGNTTTATVRGWCRPIAQCGYLKAFRTRLRCREPLRCERCT